MTWSPVPFGGESYADPASPSLPYGVGAHGLQCLSAVSPMRTTFATETGMEFPASPVPFGGESYADTDAVRALVEAAAGSPVPFGGESYADVARVS